MRKQAFAISGTAALIWLAVAAAAGSTGYGVYKYGQHTRQAEVDDARSRQKAAEAKLETFKPADDSLLTVGLGGALGAGGGYALGRALDWRPTGTLLSTVGGGALGAYLGNRYSQYRNKGEA